MRCRGGVDWTSSPNVNADRLLSVAALTPTVLRTLSEQAAAAGVDDLVAVHNEEELAVAADAGSTIISINNRNHRTHEVDMTASETLIGRIPKASISVSESG